MKIRKFATTMTYNELWRSLTGIYDEHEARMVVRMVAETAFGLSLTDVLCGGLEQLPAAEQPRLAAIHKRLLAGEPIQYILGVAEFGPYTFAVTPGVLIPRPETYELCAWIVSSFPKGKQGSMLDIGTGSGCIACTLAAELPEMSVTAWDISDQALKTARQNAEQMKVSVSLHRQDMLDVKCGEDSERWDLIVSNPPYVCESEAAEMTPQVLDFEPWEALFVPDADPLRFYRPVCNYARLALKVGGRLCFEINPHYSGLIEAYLLELGFEKIENRKDQFGKIRFISAVR